MANELLVIDLRDRQAQHMGEGVSVLCQKDAGGGPQSVVVTVEDLGRLFSAWGQ